MGMFQSCLSKKNKVGVLSVDEEAAYKKIKRETERQLLEDNDCKID
jgi:hypothetical protein